MVRDFHIVSDLKQIGYYSAFVTSSHFCGELLSAYLWGALSDRFGRRPVLLTTSAAATISIFAFGLSPSLWFAALCQFVFGAATANIAVQKSYIVRARLIL